MKKLRLLLIVAACVAALSGQTPDKKGPKKPGSKPEVAAKPSALDKTTMENYVRHLQAWDHSIILQVGDPKPGPMEGFYEDKVKSVLNIPDEVRVVALLGIGRRKGPDKRYGGRHEMRDICFSEKWAEPINL